MRKTKNFNMGIALLAITTAAILILITPRVSSATTVEKIVATVDGTAITMFELDQAVKAYGPELRKQHGVAGTSLRAKALSKLIDDKLFENELKKSDLKVEPHEIDSFIDRILRGNRITLKTFQDELLKKGMTLEKYREQLHDQILRDKFLTNYVGRKVNITERELKDYFDKHMDEFKSTSSVQLAQISIPFTATTTPDDLDKIEKVAFDIARSAKSTSDFDLLASKFSGKPFTVQGGNFGVVGLDDLQPAIANVAIQLEAGQVSTPIVTNTGVHIIKVIDRAKTSAKDFATARDQVYNMVYDVKMREALESYAKQLKKKARIEIKGLGLK